ncbi:hypothetical protein PTKIN_Ptkin13bG0233000 [Pterospermum kingtungense]
MDFQKLYCVVFVVMIILPLKPNRVRAAVLVKTNATYHHQYCNGLLSGCTIGEDLESELEFFLGSDIIRILKSGGGTKTGGTPNRYKPAIKQKDCPPPYTQCIAKGPGGHHGPGCKGSYCRPNLSNH